MLLDPNGVSERDGRVELGAVFWGQLVRVCEIVTQSLVEVFWESTVAVYVVVVSPNLAESDGVFLVEDFATVSEVLGVGRPEDF